MSDEPTGRRLKQASHVRKEKFDGISPMTEWRWQKERGMPKPIKIGGVKFYDECELDRWIDNLQRGERHADPA